MKKVVIIAASTIFLLLLAYWGAISQKKVNLSLTNGQHCEWRRNEWLTGASILWHDKDGDVHKAVQFRKGLFEHPAAMFPGLAPDSVICVYILDTTIAVFVVDLTSPGGSLQQPPPLFQSIVAFSTCPLRGCTKREVAYIKSYIAEASEPLCRQTFGLGDCRVGGERLKRNLLRLIDLGTVPQEERTGEARNEAHPQIPVTQD